MTAVPVTGVVSMGLGRKDSRPWKAWSPVYRQGSAGEVITTRGKEFPVQVVAGVFSAMLEPGVCVIENPDGKQYTVTIPAEGGDLWDIIDDAVAFPPDTATEALAAAVTGWLEDNPVVTMQAEGITDSGAAGREAIQAATGADLRAAAGASTLGAEVFTAANPAAGREALGAAPKDSVIHASEMGLVASEATNVSTAFGSLLTSVPEGSTIQLQAGAYNVSTLRNLVYNNNVTIRGVPGRTRLVGDGSRSGTSYINDIMIRVDGGSISFDHIAFEGTGTPVGMKGLMELDDISFTDCTFTDCTGIAVEVYDPTGVATRLAAGKQLSWRNFKMTGCKAYNCEMGVILRTDGGYDSVIVGDNVFNGVGFAGVWVGSEYGLNVDRSVFQALQARVTIHDNVFRDMRLSEYADTGFFVTPQVNAIVALGQSITIHDNLIENVTNSDVWDDCEAIYTKGRYFDIHDNIMINPGGSEAAIMVKGIAYDQSTTLAASMDGVSLPQSTISVASTEGFGPATTQTAIAVQTSEGLQVVTFTGKTATSFTGCSGGTGTMSTGGLVRGEISSGNMTGVSQPGKIHHNTVVFTRTDVAQNAITTAMPGLEISDNLIDGATHRAITAAAWADRVIVKNNRIINHHGTVAILAAANGVVVDGNSIEQIDGSYEASATSLRAIFVEAGFSNVAGVIIRNNVLYNRLAADGTRSAASQKLRFLNIQGVGSYAVSDVRVTGNKARNISIGINAVVDGPISDLLALDNDWQNEDGSAISQVVAHASPRMIRDSGVLRGSSGVENALVLRPVVVQSGTAGYNGFFVDVTEVSTGSGNKNLMEARLAGSIYWSVDNTGRMRLPMGAIELGNASDTTVQRASAGRISVEGNVVAHVLSATATLDFGSVAAQSFVDLTITVAGAAAGDCVSLGVPTAAVTAGIAYTAWVSATNTVTVRAHNYTAGALDPASGSFKAAILR